MKPNQVEVEMKMDDVETLRLQLGEHNFSSKKKTRRTDRGKETHTLTQ